MFNGFKIMPPSSIDKLWRYLKAENIKLNHCIGLNADILDRGNLAAYYSSISTRLPEILDCNFWVGVASPNFGEGEAVGGRGWYRSKERW